MVSIIVPIYNCERFLKQCIDSIISQSYQDWELILIDDGSEDKSALIADYYAIDNKKINVIHTLNEGLSLARNLGLEIAKGEYITFVDADDILMPNAISTLIKVAERTDADIVAGRFCYGKEFRDNPVTDEYREKTFMSLSAIEDTLYQKTLVPSASGKLYKYHLFNELRFDVGLYYEDLAIFYKLFLKSNKIVHIDYPVYFYRETPDSILHTWNKRRLDVLKVTEQIEKYMSTHHPELIEAAIDRRLSANFNIFALALINNERPLANQCWDYIKANRYRSLFNIKVRLKNKIGILFSLLGKNIFSKISFSYYRNK